MAASLPSKTRHKLPSGDRLPYLCYSIEIVIFKLYAVSIEVVYTVQCK